jgi:hypothetical protein
MVEDKQQPGWTYHPDDQQEPEKTDQHHKPEQKKEITWTASEFMAHHKDLKWYSVFFLLLVLGVAGVYLLTGDIISTIAIAVVGILFAFVANRKPRQLPYKLDNQGVTVSSRFYPYNTFKSFALLREGAVDAINFMPLQRLQPELTIYFPPEEEDAILNILTDYLPNDQKTEKAIDRFARKIRF